MIQKHHLVHKEWIVSHLQWCRFPSKIAWDRIPTKPLEEVATELLDSQVFCGHPWTVGPVGDFLDWWDQKKCLASRPFFGGIVIVSDPNSKVISDLQLYGIELSRIELDYLVAVICLFFLCHLIQLAAVILLFVSTYKNLMTREFVKNCEATKPSPSPVDNSCTARNPTPTPNGLGHLDSQEPNWICPCKHLGGRWVDGFGQMVGSLVDLWLPIPKMAQWMAWLGLTDEEMLTARQTTLGWSFKNPKMSLLGYYQGNQQLVPSHVPPRETSCKETLDKLALYTPDKSSRKHLIPKCYTGGVPLGKLQDDSLRRRGFNPHLSIEWNYVRYIFTYKWDMHMYIIYICYICMYINNVVYMWSLEI